MIATLVENAVRVQERRLVRDAEAVLGVAAWADLPAGLSILPMDRADASGSCTGSGHTLAIACGLRPGAVAVRVDVAGILRAAVAAAPFAPDAALDVARTIAEGVAVHEAAHALVSARDTVGSHAEAVAFVAACNRLPLRTGAESHGPVWAAAVVLLSRRVISLRPTGERIAREAYMRADIAGYGLDADAIAEALGPVPDEASVRALLAPGGAVARRVAAVCPGVAEREAFIEQRRQHGAAGARDRVSSEGGA
ncbi:MAG: hypothetical protein WCR51_04355 [Planctomycetia bacterium]